MKVRKRNAMLSIMLPMLDQPHWSKSGKSFLIATSHGPKRTALKFNGRNLIVAVTAYTKPEKASAKADVKRRRKSVKYRRLNGMQERVHADSRNREKDS